MTERGGRCWTMVGRLDDGRAPERDYLSFVSYYAVGEFGLTYG